MADWMKAIKRYLKEKHGVHMDEWQQEKKPVLEMREKQGEAMWQGDIGLLSSEQEEEEKKKKEEVERKKKESGK